MRAQNLTPFYAQIPNKKNNLVIFFWKTHNRAKNAQGAPRNVQNARFFYAQKNLRAQAAQFVCAKNILRAQKIARATIKTEKKDLF